MNTNEKKCRSCTNKANRNALYCTDCALYRSKRQSDLRRSYFSKGLCWCGKEPHGNLASCIGCINSKRRYMRRRYKELRAQGRCVQCAGPSNGTAACRECTVMRSQSGKPKRKLWRVTPKGRVCQSCWRSDEIASYGSYIDCCRSCEGRRDRNGSCPNCGYAMYWPMRRLPQCPWCYPEFRLQGKTMVVDRLVGAISNFLRSIGRAIEAAIEPDWAHAGWRTVRKAVFRLRHLNELNGWVGRREYAAATPGSDKAASRHWWRLLRHLENYNVPHEIRTRDARKEVLVLMEKYDIMGPPPRPRS